MAYRPLITPKSERCSSQMQPAGTCKRRSYERTADRSSIRERPRFQARAQETSTRAATRRRNGRAQAQSRCQTRNEACMRRGSHHQANSRGCRRAQDRETAPSRSPSAKRGSRSCRHSRGRRGSSKAARQPSQSHRRRSEASGNEDEKRRRSKLTMKMNRQTGNARHQATRRENGRSQLLHHQPDRSMAERPRCEQTQDARERQKRCTHERCCSPRYETRQLEPESRCTRSQTSSPIQHGEPCCRCDMSANRATQMQTRSQRRAPSMAYRPLITPKLERCSSQMQPAGTCKRRSHCLLYTSPSPRDRTRSRMPSSA